MISSSKLNRELCGEGFRDMRGLINCKGCGLKFKSAAEFSKHGKQMEERKREQPQQIMKGRELGGSGDKIKSRPGVQRDGAKPGVVEQIAEKTQMAENAPVKAKLSERNTRNREGQSYSITQGHATVKMPGHDTAIMPRRDAASVPVNLHGHPVSLGQGQAGQAPAASMQGQLPIHSMANIPSMHTQHPAVLPSVPQQLLQQQLQQQQLAFQHQQQLMILKQQQQAAAFPVLQHQATSFPVQQVVSDRDRQIALLEEELRVQKMMMEVERREAVLREQAALLSVQAERMKLEKEQMQVQRSYMSVPSFQHAVQQNGWEAKPHDTAAANGGVQQSNGAAKDQVSEKQKLERMFQLMERARQEELEKTVLGRNDLNAGATVDYQKVGVGKTDNAEVSSSRVTKGTMNTKVRNPEVRPVIKVPNNALEVGNECHKNNKSFPFDESDDVFDASACLNDDAAEQLKIFEEIKSRNEETKKQEEMSMKLISKLSLAEDDEQAPQGLGESEVATAGETVGEKIERLKKMADRRGMSVNSNKKM